MMGKKEKQACGRKPVYRDDEFIAGEHVWSLTVTDIPTAWTENRARRGKGCIGVLNQIMDIGKRIPFDLKGFHCDSGGEFPNPPLARCFTDRPWATSRRRSSRSA